MRDELNAGGIAALHHYLLSLDLDDFDEHTKPPETQAKRDLMDVGAGNVQRFIKAWLGGDVWFDKRRLPVCPCGSGDLYTAYTRWCREDGVRTPREANQFSGEVAKLPGWTKGFKDRYDDLHMIGKPVRWRFIVPGADTLNAAARLGEDYRQQETENQTQWLTRCFFAFTDALGSQT